jgi:hypothetical protein
VFATTLLPSKAPYAIKIVAKCSLLKERAKQKVCLSINYAVGSACVTILCPISAAAHRNQDSQSTETRQRC